MHLFSENIKQLEGFTVKVIMEHGIYGKQHVTIRKFKPLYAENKLGFIINEKEKFLYTDEIENIECEQGMFKIVSKLQTITILY